MWKISKIMIITNFYDIYKKYVYLVKGTYKKQQCFIKRIYTDIIKIFKALAKEIKIELLQNNHIKKPNLIFNNFNQKYQDIVTMLIYI